MIKVSLKIFNAKTMRQEEKTKDAVSLIERVVNSDAFRDAVLKYGYERHYSKGWLWSKKWYTEWVDGFTSTKETPAQVYARIMSGITQDESTPDQELDFRVEVLNGGNGRVIGYTSHPYDRTYTYAWVFNDYSIAELAGHLAHEYFHRVHYSHSSASDHNSVPYAVGYIVEKIGKQMNGEK